MTASIPVWLGIAIAVIYLPMTENAPSWTRSAVKTLPLVAFAVAAWMARAPWPLPLGLALSAAGDFALSRRGERAFLAGLSAFALAHVAYVLLFLGLSGQPLLVAFTTKPLLAAFLIAVTASTEVWLTPHVGALKAPLRVYALVITGMGLAALTLPLGKITLGAGYFIASDVLLAFQLFRMGQDNPLVGRTGWLVWALYVAGQALILTGSLA
jgi:uncharacterized membrane protein YhhN